MIRARGRRALWRGRPGCSIVPAGKGAAEPQDASVLRTPAAPRNPRPFVPGAEVDLSER